LLFQEQSGSSWINASNMYVCITMVKVEEGNFLTNWTLHPDEISANVQNSINQAISGVQSGLGALAWQDSVEAAMQAETLIIGGYLKNALIDTAYLRTQLLQADQANIAGWIFRNQRLESQSGGAYLDGRTGEVAITGKFESSKNGNRIIIDPASQKIQMINTNNKVVLDISFYNDSSGSSPNVILYNYNTGGTEVSRTQMFGGRVILSINGSSVFDVGRDSNNMIYWFIDPSKLPTSTTYTGQIYRNGNNLCVRTS